MSASSTVASLIPELIIIFFGGVKNDIMLELLELANMIKSFSCSRCSAKSFIKKKIATHMLRVWWIVQKLRVTHHTFIAWKLFSLIEAMGMTCKQNLAGAGHEWLHSTVLQLDSWPWVFTRMLDLNYEMTAKSNWHDLIKSPALLLCLDFYFQCHTWIFLFSI